MKHPLMTTCRSVWVWVLLTVTLLVCCNAEFATGAQHVDEPGDVNNFAPGELETKTDVDSTPLVVQLSRRLLPHEGRRLAGGANAPFTFFEVNQTLTFLIVLWVSGKLAAYFGLPALVAEIIMGMLLGPGFAEFVPKSDAVMLFGELGLILLVLEAGLDVNVEMLKIIGLRGIYIAIAGSMTPLAIGIGLGLATGHDTFAALSIGATLAPTSMGIALAVLRSGKVHNTPTAQLIVAAAVLDDVIALILLSELRAMGNPDAGAWDFISPVFWAVALIAIFLIVAVKVTPVVTDKLKSCFPQELQEYLILCLIFGSGLALLNLCYALGQSHLLGAFLAGLCFCTEHSVHHVWVHQVKRIMQWMLRLFFAATIGFAVPFRELWKPEVMGPACLYLIALIGKVGMGFFASPFNKYNFMKIAFAMSAWGEFAFIVASNARLDGIINQDTFASLILAVLISVIISPILLRLAIGCEKKYNQKMLDHAKDHVDPHCDEYSVYYCLQTKSTSAWGHQDRLMRIVYDNSLEIIDFRSWHGYRYQSFVLNEIYLKDKILKGHLHTTPLHRHEDHTHQEKTVFKTKTGIVAKRHKQNHTRSSRIHRKMSPKIDAMGLPTHMPREERDAHLNKLVAERIEKLHGAFWEALGEEALDAEVHIARWFPDDDENAEDEIRSQQSAKSADSQPLRRDKPPTPSFPISHKPSEDEIVYAIAEKRFQSKFQVHNNAATLMASLSRMASFDPNEVQELVQAFSNTQQMTDGGADDEEKAPKTVMTRQSSVRSLADAMEQALGSAAPDLYPEIAKVEQIDTTRDCANQQVFKSKKPSTVRNSITGAELTRVVTRRNTHEHQGEDGVVLEDPSEKATERIITAREDTRTSEGWDENTATAAPEGHVEQRDSYNRNGATSVSLRNILHKTDDSYIISAALYAPTPDLPPDIPGGYHLGTKPAIGGEMTPNEKFSNHADGSEGHEGHVRSIIPRRTPSPRTQASSEHQVKVNIQGSGVIDALPPDRTWTLEEAHETEMVVDV